MTPLPLMITDKDDELLGVANRSDAMGILAVWSVRARDLVPHLTEQTTDIRGFQILVEAFRLWEEYEQANPKHAGRLDDFFILVEQAFARTIGWHDREWSLPGARRVKARAPEDPHISLRDHSWHLLGTQKANGLWGLYRGASRRAGLLNEDMTCLSSATMVQAASNGLKTVAQKRLLDLIAQAMEGKTVALPPNKNNQLTSELYNIFHQIPLAQHFREKILNEHSLNSELASRMTSIDKLNHRQFLTDAQKELEEHSHTIENAIYCENFLAVIEAVFLWLCANKGKTLEDAVKKLPVNLKALTNARLDFCNSGTYYGKTAITRHALFHGHLDTSNRAALARSVLLLHQKISEERHRSAWVWEENGFLHSDVDFEQPPNHEFEVGVAWRNDYYLYPLQCVAQQLAKVST